MGFSFQTLVLLPIGLGLLGFIEPCTIGGHLLFLDTQKHRATRDKIKAVSIFIAVRAFVAGLFGVFITYLGQQLIAIQTGIWLVFGLLYLALGIAFLIGKSSWMKRQLDFAPSRWKRAQNPAVLGLAFGLNIPACAAPILFGLLGLAASTGTVMMGALMMFLFGMFLSLPLALFAVIPKLANKLDTLAARFGNTRWLIGLVFVALGLWSIWFGLYVDPQAWSGQ